MNAVAQAIASLEPTLASPRNVTEYTRAHADHPALAPHATPADALAALAPTSPLGLAERDAVVLGLLTVFGDAREAREALEVLLVARTGRGPLLDYVDATYPGLTPAKRARTFERLHRMRDRALKRLVTLALGVEIDEEADAAV